MLDAIGKYALPLSILALAFSIYSVGIGYLNDNRYEFITVKSGVVNGAYIIDKRNGTYTFTTIDNAEVIYRFQNELDKPKANSAVLDQTIQSMLRGAGLVIPDVAPHDKGNK